MDQLLPIMNQLQDVFNDVGLSAKIDLPQIAVVGAQSSGKSSVLEALVGRDFLPRGSGIVTRRPLVLQLINTKTADPWGEFLHKPNVKFTDFNKIRSEIENATDLEAGSGKGVSRNPINLKVMSGDVMNLTLVDLPGITKVAIGDQPSNIEEQIRDLVMEYIERKNCIILAVSAANQDIANSDALKTAREVDPAGDRTIGVLTKLDLMDKGTDALDVLLGKVIPLKRGYIGVVNRSQSDINTNKGIDAAIRSEREFFQSHPAYSRISSRMGTAHLAKTLNAILLQHIRETLPELKSKIYDLISQTQAVRRQLGDDIEGMTAGALLLNLLTKYSNCVTAKIDGTDSDNVPKAELTGGARINYIFNQAFSPYIMNIQALEGLTDEAIRTTIDNAKGPRSALFIPEQAFEMLVKQQVLKLEEPCLRCCDHVYDELLKICEDAEKELGRYPKLRSRVNEETVKLLHSFLGPLREFISNLIKIELAYINTYHPHFFSGGAVADKIMSVETPAIPQRVEGPRSQSEGVPGARESGVPQGGPSQGPSNDYHGPPGDRNSGVPVPNQSGYRMSMDVPSMPAHAGANFHAVTKTAISHFNEMPERIRAVDLRNMSDRQRRETEVIKQLLTSYVGIVQISVMDKIPKSIIHFLVNKVKECLQNELVTLFYKEQLFEELLQESEEVAARRTAANAMLKCLTQAADTLGAIRDFRL